MGYRSWLVGVLGVVLSGTAQAGSWNLVFGMSQPLVLNGGNVEVNYVTDKWVFEYSHGFNLDLNTSPGEQALSQQERDQGLTVFAPYSTGGGIGYRFTEALNIRLELKQHRFQVENPEGESIDYITRDLGVGAYYFYRPLRQYRLLIVPSVRYWPTVHTTLEGDRYHFANGEVHQAHDFGLFGNISVGWSF